MEGKMPIMMNREELAEACGVYGVDYSADEHVDVIRPALRAAMVAAQV